MRAVGILVAILFVVFTVPQAFAQDYGSISGIVTSASNANVPDAIVTLWSTESGEPTLAYVPNNPQYSANYSSAIPGLYTFAHVPPGPYNITAMWNGYWFYTAVNLTGGTVTANIVIPAYLNATAFVSPTPAPKTYYTYVPVHISSPRPQATTRSPGFTTVAVLLSIPIAILARKCLRR